MMFFTEAVVLAAAVVAAGGASESTKAQDPVVCKKDRSFDTGSHMRRKAVCKLKSEWAFEERESRRELQAIKEKGVQPMPAAPAAGAPQ